MAALGRAEPNQSCGEVTLAIKHIDLTQQALIFRRVNLSLVPCEVLKFEASPVVFVVKVDALDLAITHLKDVILAVHLFKQVSMVLSWNIRAVCAKSIAYSLSSLCRQGLYLFNKLTELHTIIYD